jgi:hypothetical protein
MSRILGTCVAVVLLVGVVYLFGGDFYHRYRISHQLDPVARAAFENCTADRETCARSLLAGCELSHGAGAPSCERYRVALQ